jgi:hypothetical protein
VAPLTWAELDAALANGWTLHQEAPGGVAIATEGGLE